MKNLIKCFQILCVLFLTSMSILTIAMKSMGDEQRVATNKIIKEDDLNSSGSSTDTSSTDVSSAALSWGTKDPYVTSDQLCKTLIKHIEELQEKIKNIEQTTRELNERVENMGGKLNSTQKQADVALALTISVPGIVDTYNRSTRKTGDLTVDLSELVSKHNFSSGS